MLGRPGQREELVPSNIHFASQNSNCSTSSLLKAA
jgi:hypothetical protein